MPTPSKFAVINTHNGQEKDPCNIMSSGGNCLVLAIADYGGLSGTINKTDIVTLNILVPNVIKHWYNSHLIFIWKLS